MDRSIDEVEFQAQQVVSLNSPRQPTQHVQKDVVERPRKPLTLNKPQSPTVKAWTEGTSLSEIVMVSLPTQETAVGDSTDGNQSKETQEAQGVSLYAHDSAFMNDSGESEGVQSFLLQPVIQGESQNDTMGPSFRVSNMDTPTRLKEASQTDSLAQIVELMKKQAEMLQSIDAGIKDNGKAMNCLHEKFDKGWYQPSRQSSRNSRDAHRGCSETPQRLLTDQLARQQIQNPILDLEMNSKTVGDGRVSKEEEPDQVQEENRPVTPIDYCSETQKNEPLMSYFNRRQNYTVTPYLEDGNPANQRDPSIRGSPVDQRD